MVGIGFWADEDDGGDAAGIGGAERPAAEVPGRADFLDDEGAEAAVSGGEIVEGRPALVEDGVRCRRRGSSDGDGCGIVPG